MLASKEVILFAWEHYIVNVTSKNMSDHYRRGFVINFQMDDVIIRQDYTVPTPLTLLKSRDCKCDCLLMGEGHSHFIRRTNKLG